MFAIASLAVLALAAIGARADVVISTPDSVSQCQPVTFQISGSTSGPYYAFFVDPANPCGDAIAEVDNIAGPSWSWTPNLPAGTSVMIALESEDGTEGWSGAFTIGAGDSSCLAGASSAPANNNAATTPTTLVATVAHTSASRSASVVPVNAASNVPASDSSNGASRSVVGFGSALALVGAAVAAFAL